MQMRCIKACDATDTNDSSEKEVIQMKTMAVGFGMLAGAALAVTAMTSMYPDLPRRMKRDGKRVVQAGKRMCGLGF